MTSYLSTHKTIARILHYSSWTLESSPSTSGLSDNHVKIIRCYKKSFPILKCDVHVFITYLLVLLAHRVTRSRMRKKNAETFSTVCNNEEWNFFTFSRRGLIQCANLYVVSCSWAFKVYTRKVFNVSFTREAFCFCILPRGHMKLTFASSCFNLKVWAWEKSIA